MERNDHGDPWIVNVPIPYTVPKEQRPNADDLDSGVWRQKVVDGVLPYLHEFKADLVLMSAGFDAHKVRRIVGGATLAGPVLRLTHQLLLVGIQARQSLVKSICVLHMQPTSPKPTTKRRGKVNALTVKRLSSAGRSRGPHEAGGGGLRVDH